MTTLKGEAITTRGASRTTCSLDHGTFAVTCDSGILADPITERSVGPGFIRIMDWDGKEVDVEWPLTLAWARDSLGRVTALGGDGVAPPNNGLVADGLKYRYESAGETEENDLYRTKRIQGAVLFVA